MAEAYTKLSDLMEDSVCFISTDPPINDFTKRFTGKFNFFTPKRSLSIPASELKLDSNPSTLARYFTEVIFNRRKSVLTWDIKKIISYFKHYCVNLDLNINYIKNPVIDLKYALSYQGRNLPCPRNFQECKDALNLVLSSGMTEPFVRNTHNELSLFAIPNMESRGVYDLKVEDYLYTFYEIESQLNGRLISNKPSDRFLAIHTLRPEQRESLRPPDFNLGNKLVFVSFDFSHMEISVLSWLSGDQDLRDALDNPDGFYESVGKTFNFDNDKSKKIGKAIFIPLIYGLQSNKLSERLKIPLSYAESIVGSLKHRFKRAFDWLDEQPNKLTDTVAVDCFGRRRDFENEPKHLIRNFSVASPASLICLDKLCKVSRLFPKNILFHIHDAYVFTVEQNEAEYFACKVKKVLESEIDFCSGLKLTVNYKIGKTLEKV